jgi:exodeoxyribonuclease V
MEWSPQQETALTRVRDWRQSGRDPVFMLGGYAGTGKTTLAKELAGGLRNAYFAAYTGKAAHVLARAGVPNVSTIHKLIYLPKDKCQGKLRDLQKEREQLALLDPQPVASLAKIDEAIKAEKANLSRPAWTLNTDSPLKEADLLVIDEYSMVDKQMGEDLLSFGCPILALGDPGQLPPIRGDCYFGRAPDFLLTEIHRQAADNPIIRLSKLVREGGNLSPGEYGSSRVVRHDCTTRDQLAEWAISVDQLLVGRNATRGATNRRMRDLLGRKDPLPETGDKLVCLRNNHKVGLLNGQMWTVSCAPVVWGDFLSLTVHNEDGDKLACLAHPNHFVGTADKLDYWTRRDAEEFDFGYALTVHKSQGSQWDSVLLFDEWNLQNRQQWLYTAITRAAESVTVVQM